MRTIQRHLPNPRHTEINRVFVKAHPGDARETARHFDAATLPWVRLLFDIRALPDILTGKRTEGDRHIGVDQVAAGGKGFMILEEVPGREVVVGSVGQFWHLEIPFATVDPADFRYFDEPGWGKLAWSIAVEPYGEGSTVSLELRTTATDDDSWEKLNRYYQVIGIGSRLIRNTGIAHIESVLGKMNVPDEHDIALPGDGLLPDAHYLMNHKIAIEAPPAIVWRYLMQLGCDRAGWYSIDALDHGGVPGADHPVPGWATRSPGDKVAVTPAQDSFFDVLAVDPERYFVLGGKTDRIGGHFDMTWTFALEPVGSDACHLYTRIRVEGTPRWKEWLVAGVVYPPLHAVMQTVELKTVKHLAERDAHMR